MIELFQLGTAGTEPSYNRALASAFIRIQGLGILIDAGEGTQMQISKCSFSCADIDYILITHLHADHVSGLMGVLLAAKSAGRSKAVRIIGPKGIKHFVDNMYFIIPHFDFEIQFLEIERGEKNRKIRITEELSIHLMAVYHSVPCYAYSIALNRKAGFDSKRAVLDGVPKYSVGVMLKNGNSFEFNGKYYDRSIITENDLDELCSGCYVEKGKGCFNYLKDKKVYKDEIPKEVWISLCKDFKKEINGVVYSNREMNFTPYGLLANGNDISYNGKIFYSKDYMGRIEKKSYKISYVVDTRPISSLREFIKGSDIVVIEGMYRGSEDAQKAKIKKHMTWDETASLVNDNNIGEVILTHYSPSLRVVPADIGLLKSKIRNGVLGRDGLYKSIEFENKEVEDSNENKVKTGSSDIPKENIIKEKIIRECYKNIGLEQLISKIVSVTAFKFQVHLVDGRCQVVNIYKSVKSMKEEYNIARQIGNHFVFIKY